MGVSRPAAPAQSSRSGSPPLAAFTPQPQAQVQTAAEAVRPEPRLQATVQAVAAPKALDIDEADATVTTEEAVRPDSCLQVVVQPAAATESIEVNTTVTAQDPNVVENAVEAAKQLEWIKSAVKRQVDYYFGENYAKDNWLRGQADEEGWISLRLVSKFNRMKGFTRDFELVQHCVASSSIVELSDCGEYVRRQPCLGW